MTQDNGASVPDRALVNEAPAGLHPAGFDPSRCVALPFPQSEIVARAIWHAAHNAYTLTLNGFDWPEKDRKFKRMLNPVPGDLVFEQGGGLREGRCDNAVGWLIEVTREPVFKQEEWDDDSPIPTERVFYIHSLQGERTRWVNAEFIAVLEEGGWWTYERQFSRDPLRAHIE